jgi:amino acid adenylation domain-containing protein
MKGTCEISSVPSPIKGVRYLKRGIKTDHLLVGRKGLKKHFTYWRKKLGGSLPVLQLPTEIPDPTQHTFLRGSYSLKLPEILCEQVKELGYREGVPLFIILIAAFKTLLHRYTGQNDLLMGIPMYSSGEQEGSNIREFGNILVLRTNLSGNPPFVELLQRVHDVYLEAYEHRGIPYQLLVEDIQQEHSMSDLSLFQVLFILKNTITKSNDLPYIGNTVNLTFSMEETSKGFISEFIYNSNLFNTNTITWMARHFQTLLEGIVAAPSYQLGKLSLLTQEEQQQLISWNDTSCEFPMNKCIHQLFEEQVERTPYKIAISKEERQLSYQELNNKANQLAQYLQKLNVRPGDLVGICVDRSIEVIVGLLAILKAGGAYVALDPTFPNERINYMLNDSEPLVLITQKNLLNNFPNYVGNVICIDSNLDLIESESTTNPNVSITPDKLAYVVYTSGSTGHPKGVMTPHRGVVNYLDSLATVYGINDSDTVLQLASVSVDASVKDIMTPLIKGAKLVLVNKDEVKDAELIYRYIQKNNVSCILSIVPSMLKILTNITIKRNLHYDSVRLILVSGEQLHLATVKQLKQIFTNALVSNLYGPTECTITSSHYPITSLELEEERIPIGKPNRNTQLYVLDEYLNFVPVGVTGEIYIGGVGVTLEYLHMPELSKQKYIRDPFSNQEGKFLFKTGDKARYFSDGNIQFLGRDDRQVKIRGYRVELSEIEAVLETADTVQTAVAMTQKDHSNNNVLIAYVVTSERYHISTTKLYNFLNSKLPEYMIPSHFVLLDSLPLTPNGKVDRNLLPKLNQTRPEIQTVYEKPRTSIEIALEEIWSEVLNTNHIGIHDNFFELGGHSLLATQLISRLRHVFDLDLPLRMLFDFSTINELAKTINEKNTLINNKPNIKRVSRDEYLMKQPFLNDRKKK